LEDISQLMLLAGATLNKEKLGGYDAAKYVWGDKNTVGYAAFPPPQLADPAASANAPELQGTLVQKSGTSEYFHIFDGQAIPARSPLALDDATVVMLDKPLDARMPKETFNLATGTIAKVQSGNDISGAPVYRYYQVLADGGGAEVTPVLQFNLNLSEARLDDWRDQLSRLTNSLGTTSSTQQVFLQQKMSEYANFLNMASNWLAEYTRTISSILR
ncbi:MAG: hypothetical protein ACRYGK_03530, partial [Janthinobacterium lividum]